VLTVVGRNREIRSSVHALLAREGGEKYGCVSSAGASLA
jgi:hypothetical protein